MSSRTVTRVILICILALLLSIRRDGFFPFSDSIDPKLWAWLLAAQSLGLLILIVAFLKPDTIVGRFSRLKFSFHIRPQLVLSLLVTGLVLFILALHLSASRTFPQYFHIGWVQVVCAAVVTISLCVIPLWLRRPKLALGGLFVAAVILFLMPILFYQITANTADLLPIIHKQLQALSQGQNIYQYYLLDNGVLTQAVRQPGTVLSFWPAFALGLDIRWMSVLFTLLTGFVILKWAYQDMQFRFDRKFALTYALVAMFLLLPYRHARHDLYEPAYWFILTLSLYMLHRRRDILFSIVWAAGIFTQVWFWLFTPFVAVYIWRVRGWRKAVEIMAPAVTLGALLLAVFIIRDPSAYVSHVFGFYAGEVAKAAYAASTIHLTPLIEVYGLARLLLPLQLIATGVIGLASLRWLNGWGRLLGCLMLAFFVFVQFNSISWNYMYIGLVLLMTAFVVSSPATHAKGQSVNDLP